MCRYLIWAAKSNQEKVHYFGDNFLNIAELEEAWKKYELTERRFLIEDEIIGQTSLWVKDLVNQFDIRFDFLY